MKILWCTAVILAGLAAVRIGVSTGIAAEPTKPMKSALQGQALKLKPLTLDEAKSQGLTKHTFPRKHNNFVTTAGVQVLAYDTGSGYQAYEMTKTSKKPLPDGKYEVQGGGTIWVKGGMIQKSDAIINNRFPNHGYVSGVIGLG